MSLPSASGTGEHKKLFPLTTTAKYQKLNHVWEAVTAMWVGQAEKAMGRQWQGADLLTIAVSMILENLGSTFMPQMI